MDGAWDWQADWCSGRSNADIVLVCHGEERAESEDKSLDRSVYVPTLTYGHKLWVMTKRIRSQIQAAKMSFLAGWRAAPLEIGWGALSPRRSLEHIKRSQLRWLGHLYTCTPGHLPREVFLACPTGRRPRGRPRTCWSDYVIQLAWEYLGILPEELEEVSREREVWVSLLRQLPPRPSPR